MAESGPVPGGCRFLAVRQQDRPPGCGVQQLRRQLMEGGIRRAAEVVALGVGGIDDVLDQVHQPGTAQQDLDETPVGLGGQQAQ
ncbi:hypothetical protein [Kitasatospora albolonga]|uniref:hypothetical protein n=1 Tax=Kitasatospora albolonga TaxID=68173 RepID=UPI0035EF19D6